MSDGVADRAFRLLGRLLLMGGVALFVFFAMGIALKPVFPEGVPPGAPFLVVFNLMAVSGLLAGHLAAVLAFERGRWDVTGLGRDAWHPVALLAAAVAGITGVLAPAAALLAGGHLEFVPGAEGAWHASLGSAALILALPALAEELLLRGYAFGAIARDWGATAAVLVTSIVFGLLHLGNPGATAWHVGAVLVAGIFLGAVRHATGSVAAAWLAHLAINWVQGGVLHAPISGLEFLPAPAFRTVATGPEWLTGGQWGLEAGAATAATLLVVTFLVLRARPAAPKRRRGN